MITPYIIIGLGQTGFSVARYLRRQGLAFAVCDTREKPANLAEFQQQFPDIPVFCGLLDSALLCQAKQLIVSPGVALATPEILAAQRAGVEIVGDVELFLRENTAPIIAITGSNGKTTVTTLVGDMAKAAGLRAAVAGNIGIPVLDVLPQQHDLWQHDLYVLELSSFQLETTTSLRAAAAVVLNVSDNHMDRYASFQDYVAAKTRIYQNADIVVINLDNPPAWQDAALGKKRIGFTVANAAIPVGVTESFTLIDGQLCCAGKPWIARAELSIQTQHHVANLLAAFALAQAAGIPTDAMLQVARTFAGIRHRCQKFLEKNEVQWINDSKGTTVAASTVALENIASTIKGKIILLAGGDGKGADFSALATPIAHACRAVILLGRDAQKIAAVIPTSVAIHFVTTLDEAVTLAQQLAVAGDAILLSPACASTDMFKNFNERGEQFMTAAQKINYV